MFQKMFVRMGVLWIETQFISDPDKMHEGIRQIYIHP